MEMKEVVINPSKKKPLILENLTFRSAFDFQLTEEDINKACRELHESEVVKRESLQKLKRKLIDDKDMCYRTDNSYLLRYLRFSKFNTEKAYSTIQQFYSVRMKYPELYALPLNLKEFMNKRFITCLPYADEKGRIIIWTKFKNWKVDEMSFNEVLLTNNIVSDIMTMNPNAQINGYVCLWDFRGFTTRHLSQDLQSKLSRIASKFLQNFYPLRVKLVIGLHCNPLIKTGFNAVRYVLKKKMTERIIFLGSDMTEMHQYLNPALLPKECGGSLLEADLTMNEIIVENLSYLEYERSFLLRTGHNSMNI